MLLVSRSLVITLFAWFPGEEDEDKGVSCLQPQGTCTSDDHDSPRDVQHPRLGGSLVPSVPTAGPTSPSAPPNPSGPQRRYWGMAARKATRERARAPHISKGADHRSSKIQTLVLKTDISLKGTCIFNLITSLTGINKVEKAREVFSCFSLQTSLQGSKHPPAPHC